MPATSVHSSAASVRLRRLPAYAFLAWHCLFGVSPAPLSGQPPIPAPSSPNAPPKSPRWKPEDFGGVLSVGLEGHRSFQKGRRLFHTSGCSSCHQFEGFGTPGTRSLSLFARHSTPEALLDALLQAPSHQPKGKPIADSLNQNDILDLLAFLISGANPKSPLFLSSGL